MRAKGIINGQELRQISLMDGIRLFRYYIYSSLFMVLHIFFQNLVANKENQSAKNCTRI